MPKMAKLGNDVRSEGSGFPSFISTDVAPPNPPVPVQPCVSPPAKVVVVDVAASAAAPEMLMAQAAAQTASVDFARLAMLMSCSLPIVRSDRVGSHAHIEVNRGTRKRTARGQEK